MWNCKAKLFINRAMRQEIDFLTEIFNNPQKYKWESPIAYLTPRPPTFSAYCDASLYGAGGFSKVLELWWQIYWPNLVQKETLLFCNKPKISINSLEFVSIMLIFAACIVSYNSNKTLTTTIHPTVRILADNISAISWSRKIATSSQVGKCLNRIFSSILRTSALGLECEHVQGVLNTSADTLSRKFIGHNSNFNVTSILLQEISAIADYTRFVPSNELLSTI